MRVGTTAQFVGGVDKEEEMYKELFEKFIDGTLTGDLVINYGEGIRPYLFYRLNGISSLTINGMNWSKFNSATKGPKPFAVTGNLSSLSGASLILPDMDVLSYEANSVVGGLNCVALHVENLTSFGSAKYAFHNYKGSHLDVYINKSCDGIKAMTNFPGVDSGSISPTKVSFVGTDGRLDYNSDTGEWDMTSD